MIKKLFLIFVPILALTVGAAIIFHTSPAHATTAFNGNNLMDDGTFNNYGSMNATQINTWLNVNFPSSCISVNNGFSAPDPTGYSPGSFTYGGNVSAGQIIYDAAQAYGINPQVLLTTLQKEQSLVSGTAGCSTLRYTGAMGYGCPDSGTTHNYSGVNLYSINGSAVTSVSGTCVSSASEAGFSQQVIHAAWLLEFGLQRSEGRTSWDIQKTNSPEAGDVWNNSDDPSTCYGGPMTAGTFKRCSSDSSAVFYDGSYTIDGTGIQIQNGATAALYWYTPHFSGNQNFDTLFQSWFGPLYVPSYNWQLMGVSYSTGGPTFVAGQPGTTTVTVKNTGTATWYNSGGTPVNLATWSSPGHNSPLYSPGWLSPNTPANMNESQVAPGGTATFTVPVNVSQTGSYVDAWNLIVQNSGWMGWQGLSPTINIIPAYTWQVNSVTYGNGTGVMIPGTQQLITVNATNTGGATWSKSSGPSIELATWGPGRTSAVMPTNAPQNWLSNTSTTTMAQSSVAPGQTASFQFYVQVPSFGYYYEHFNLVAQGQKWFNDVGLTLYLKGASYSWSPVSSSYSLGSTSDVNRGTTFTVTIKAQNTGEATWYQSSTWPINIATDFPENRGSIIYNGSWINSTTPAGLQESSVAPGQVGTFVFPVTVASSTPPGTWNEHFNLVAQGLAWLNDPGFYLHLSVH